MPSDKFRVLPPKTTRNAKMKGSDNQDNIQYDWVLLASLRASEVKQVNSIPSNKEPGDLPGHLVMRLTLLYEKSTSPPAKPGKMFLTRRTIFSRSMELPNVGSSSGTSEPHGPAGAGFILDKNGLFPSGSLKYAESAAVNNPYCLETDQAPLDKAIKLLLVEETTVELPKKMSLLRIGDQEVTLQVDK